MMRRVGVNFINYMTWPPLLSSPSEDTDAGDNAGGAGDNPGAASDNLPKESSTRAESVAPMPSKS